MNGFTVIQRDFCTIYPIYLNSEIVQSSREVTCSARIGAVCLIASRKPTGATETVYEFYIGPWTKVRSDPVWSRCSATPGLRQVYIVSRAAIRIPTCLLRGPYPLIFQDEHKIVIDTSYMRSWYDKCASTGCWIISTCGERGEIFGWKFSSPDKI